MTIYEQIQLAINYIEKNLCNEIGLNEVAKNSAMSIRSFQNYFWIVTGIQYKKYLVQRRLETSLLLLKKSTKSIDVISRIVGYNDHSSFSRAFRREYKCSPLAYRNGKIKIEGMKKMELYNEMYHGIIVKELPKMYSISFSAFAPDSESKAKYEMNEWLQHCNIDKKSIRIFGHNIDKSGNTENLQNNSGYKFYACFNNEVNHAEVIEPGKFMVTGIEGNFENDKNGCFIAEGWNRMNAMIKEKNFKVKSNGRWFEEELEPNMPGNLRLDLYIELE